ncbi:hypothetical protein HH682_06725 [Rosenbergiella sp. S61]|uniref:Uncharacterized protein n=1 Tax=Rosenbergiella gaditana TaxID=2726987 RepID=A0ABS5SVJ0_9GAMM|nr:hypothetical protein [Rosenbergiella gaditana]MBT0724135.1 hypothetical protein [Rosenbergiella gaditana]
MSLNGSEYDVETSESLGNPMQSIGAQQAKVPHGLSVLEKLGYSEGIHVIRMMSTEFFSTRSEISINSTWRM